MPNLQRLCGPLSWSGGRPEARVQRLCNPQWMDFQSHRELNSCWSTLIPSVAPVWYICSVVSTCRTKLHAVFMLQHKESGSYWQGVTHIAHVAIWDVLSMCKCEITHDSSRHIPITCSIGPPLSISSPILEIQVETMVLDQLSQRIEIAVIFYFESAGHLGHSKHFKLIQQSSNMNVYWVRYGKKVVGGQMQNFRSKTKDFCKQQ